MYFRKWFFGAIVVVVIALVAVPALVFQNQQLRNDTEALQLRVPSACLAENTSEAFKSVLEFRGLSVRGVAFRFGGYVLTAGHSIDANNNDESIFLYEDQSSGYGRSYGGEEYEVLYRDTELDFAVLVPVVPDENPPVSVLRPYEREQSVSGTKSSVCFFQPFGVNGGESSEVSALSGYGLSTLEEVGYDEIFNTALVQRVFLSQAAENGFSGSPVLVQEDGELRVVGIATNLFVAPSSDGEERVHIVYLVDINLVCERTAQAGINLCDTEGA